MSLGHIEMGHTPWRATKYAMNADANNDPTRPYGITTTHTHVSGQEQGPGVAARSRVVEVGGKAVPGRAEEKTASERGERAGDPAGGQTFQLLFLFFFLLVGFKLKRHVVEHVKRFFFPLFLRNSGPKSDDVGTDIT